MLDLKVTAQQYKLVKTIFLGSAQTIIYSELINTLVYQWKLFSASILGG